MISFIKQLIKYFILNLPDHAFSNKLRIKLLQKQGIIQKGDKDFFLSTSLFIKGNISLSNGINISRNSIIASSYNSKISIGENTMIGPNVVIRSDNHKCDSIDADMKYQGYEHKEITIARNCWIAANCVILPGAKLSEGTVVAAGAVVVEGEYPANIVLGGVPAKVIKRRS